MHFKEDRWNISVLATRLVGRLEQHSTKVGQSRFVTATQLKYRVWAASGVDKYLLVKFWESMACVCEVRLLFLTLPPQGTIPQILKLKFPVWNRNVSKINRKL